MKGSLWILILLVFHTIVLTKVIADESIKNEMNSLLVDKKCSKCHTIRRVFIHARTEDEWHEIILKMKNKLPDWIRQDDQKRIFHEIVTHWQERVQDMTAERKNYNDNKLLFLDRCTICHTVNRILKKNKSSEEWYETVERMRLEASDYITKKDATRIAAFLSERSEILKEDVGSTLFVNKCLVCHPPGEKVLLEKHNRSEWKNIVKDRQQYARNSEQRIIIGNEEAKIILDLLVKTQGL